MAEYIKGNIYSSLSVHRFMAVPVKIRDYDVEEINGKQIVKSFPVPKHSGKESNRWSLKNMPIGISCFIPIDVPHKFPMDMTCTTLQGKLNDEWKFVFTHIMKIKLENTYTTAYHFNLYCEISLSLEHFLNILNTPNDNSYQWLPCILGGQGKLIDELHTEDDLDDWSDFHVRTFLYYLKNWYKDTVELIDKLYMNDLYDYLVTEKPDLEVLSQHSFRCNMVFYLLTKYKSPEDDPYGNVLLQDVLLSLDEIKNSNVSDIVNKS